MLDNYAVDGFGVIHQVDSKPIKYDKQYISYYEDLSDRTIKLGYQRLGWVLGITGEIPGPCWRLDMAPAHSSKPRK